MAWASEASPQGRGQARRGECDRREHEPRREGKRGRRRARADGREGKPARPAARPNRKRRYRKRGGAPRVTAFGYPASGGREGKAGGRGEARRKGEPPLARIERPNDSAETYFSRDDGGRLDTARRSDIRATPATLRLKRMAADQGDRLFAAGGIIHGMQRKKPTKKRTRTAFCAACCV